MNVNVINLIPTNSINTQLNRLNPINMNHISINNLFKTIDYPIESFSINHININ